jgi:hypothetical protein
MRDHLRRLHKLAGSPTKDDLEEHAVRCGRSVGRSTLATVTIDSDSAPRWSTVEAFVDACISYAKAHRRQLPPDEVDMMVWRTRYDEAFPVRRRARSSKGQQQVKVVGMVPGLADCFQPRAQSDDLGHATDDGGTAVPAGTTPTSPTASTWLLTGMGGVGKTQLAVGLAHHLRDTGQLDLLVWVSATSRQAIITGYAQAAVDMALPGTDGTDTERDVARFHAWLSTTDQRWLVVLDDLNTAADLKELWPPIRPTGRAVVTTRLRGSALTGSGRYLVPVDVFTPAEAAAYLKARLTDHPELADDVDGLANALYHLPLALAHATAYLIDEDIACTEYQRRLDARGHRLDELAPPTDELPDDYTRTVAATVSLSVQAADQTRPIGLATPLLRLASVLNPTGIPESVFATTAARNWLAYTAADAASLDATTIRSGLRLLHRLNLITVAGITVTVHGLVQRVIRDEATRRPVTDDHLADLVWAAADALAEAWPTVERDPALGQTFRANTAAVYQHGQHTLLSPDTHAVLHRANQSLGEAGNSAGAATATEELLADQVRVLGPGHLNTLVTRSDLAYWRGLAGDLAGAITATEELLADQVRVLGPGHPITLVTRSNLASWRGEAGDPAGAVTAFEELLAYRLRVLGPDHPDTLITRGNLAYRRGQAEDPAGAATAFEELLADQLRVLGPDRSDTLTTRNNLAIWRGQAGDPAGAATATEDLLDAVVRVLGPDHPYALTTRNNLAYWRAQAGDLAGAGTAFEELLADQLRVLGPDHPDTLTTRNNLASWRREAGDLAGAGTAFEELLADQLRVLGPDHPNTLATRHNLAHWREQAGDPTNGDDI